MREMRFRAWGIPEGKMYIPFTLKEAIEEQGAKMPDDNVYMQFTGLKDCHGKEIYEGDILKYYYPHAPENENGRIKEIRWVGYRYDITDRCSKNWKVIGNLWENPELLKEAR